MDTARSAISGGDGARRRYEVLPVSRRAAVCAFALVALVAAPAARAQSSSASYVLRQASVNGAGRSSVSANFRMSGTLANEIGVGVSADQTFLLQSGFWGFVGSGPVDIVLAVDRSDGASGDCDLRWSGNSSTYEIFASSDCTSVFDSPYGTSSDNSLLGVTPPTGRLSCFNVVSLPKLPRAGR